MTPNRRVLDRPAPPLHWRHPSPRLIHHAEGLNPSSTVELLRQLIARHPHIAPDAERLLIVWGDLGREMRRRHSNAAGSTGGAAA